jgi:hypothetical protein
VAKDLDYQGVPELNKKRRLTEILPDSPEAPAPAPDESDPIEAATTALFTRLGKTYLKGEVLKGGLAAMEPAQTIPISPDADRVSRSADRLDTNGSKRGTVIPFTLYQECVKDLADRQWKVRRVYENVDLPADYESASQRAYKEHDQASEEIDNIIDQFLTGEGIAGAILSALAISPFQNLGFQALGLEQGTKAYFSLQVPLGLAVLIELGVKAKRIHDLLKETNNSTPEVEKLVKELDESPEARKKVLDDAGFKYDNFVKSQKATDSKVVLEYCNSYISTHNPNSTQTYDHWVAYGNVTARQNLVRGALDSATKYSKDFAVMLDRDAPSTDIRPLLISGQMSRRRMKHYSLRCLSPHR